MNQRCLRRWISVWSFSVPLLLSACANTIPKPDYDKQIATQYLIRSNDHPQVKVETGDGVHLLAIDRERIREIIAEKLDKRRMSNPPIGAPRSCIVNVTITRYQRGNAFERAMLAGLGQIHINGDVLAMDASSKQTLDEFKIAKTFAWGGIYGASTSMQDIERTFADGVAAALTGQAESQKPAEKELKDPAYGK
ncbi:MAG: DUF4410 domain-containing protein [Steroidobacteraceae bacterium]|nr:DUF4410 domain-containing protein [Steroidobacteraceae bacterium]